MHALHAAAAALPPSVVAAEVAALAIVLGVLIDTWGIGGPRYGPLFDRLALIFWVAGIDRGFAGSGLTETIKGFITGVFAAAAGMWDAPLFVGLAYLGPQLIALLTAALALGIILPKRIKIVGRLSDIEVSHLRQASDAAMANTGVSRTGGPPAKGGLMKKLFPGTVNFGMVALALLFVTTSTMITGGVATGMAKGIDACVAISTWAATPVLAATGAA